MPITSQFFACRIEINGVDCGETTINLQMPDLPTDCHGGTWQAKYDGNDELVKQKRLERRLNASKQRNRS